MYNKHAFRRRVVSVFPKRSKSGVSIRFAVKYLLFSCERVRRRRQSYTRFERAKSREFVVHCITFQTCRKAIISHPPPTLGQRKNQKGSR